MTHRITFIVLCLVVLVSFVFSRRIGSQTPCNCPCPTPTPSATPTPTATPTPAPTPSGNIITLDPSAVYQTWIGAEATAQAGQDFSDWNTYKHDLVNKAVEAGINRLRINLRINTEANTPNLQGAVNDNGNPFSINPSGFQWNNVDLGIGQQIEVANLMRARLAAQGETLHVALCYVDFRIYAFEHHTNPEEFAELFEAAFLHFSTTQGWVPDSVEVLLEPDHSNKDWTAAKLAHALVATRNRLASRGWFPRFIAPSTTLCDNADIWYNAMKAANPVVAQIMANGGELSYHRYGTCTQAQVDQNKATAEADGVSLSMLEKIGANYNDLHTDLKAGAAAWQQHALGYDTAVQSDGGSNYFLINHGSHTVTIASRTKLLRQYFKYIRRGAVRIGAASGNATFDPVAFINTNGKYVVVVKAIAGGSFSVRLPAGSYGIKYTTGSRYDIDLPDQTIGNGGTVSASIPSAGVITVYGK